jgi:hypothetical protein
MKKPGQLIDFLRKCLLEQSTKGKLAGNPIWARLFTLSLLTIVLVACQSHWPEPESFQSSALPAYIPSNFDTTPYYEVTDTEFQDDIGEGKFRTFCRPGKVGIFDPIVYPGQTGVGHEHLFFGNKLVGPNSTYRSLRLRGDSTCDGGPLNRTAYWVPAARKVSDNKLYRPKFILIYYSEDARYLEPVQKLPPGLRMIAGWSAISDQTNHFYWQCSEGSTHYPYFPVCPVGEAVIGSVQFPACWDGVNIDSPDHRLHMAYIYYDNGVPTCPATHPVHLPHIEEKFWFYPPSTTMRVPQLYLSSDRHDGMTHRNGSTLHADWFGAWDKDAENLWFNNCIKAAKGCNNSLVDLNLRLHNNPPPLQ